MTEECNALMHEELRKSHEDKDYRPTFLENIGERDSDGDLIHLGDIVDHEAFRDVVVRRNGIYCLSRNDKQPISVHGFDKMKVIGSCYEDEEGFMNDIELVGEVTDNSEIL